MKPAPVVAHPARVTSVDPLEIRPRGSSQGVPASNVLGYVPVLDDEVAYVTFDKSQLLVLGGFTPGGGSNAFAPLRVAFTDPNARTNYGPIDLSGQIQSWGGPYAARLDVSGDTVRALTDGWYSISATGEVAGLATGDLLYASIHSPDWDTYYFDEPGVHEVGVAGQDVELYIPDTGLFFVSGAPWRFRLSFAGPGAGETITGAALHLVAY